MKLYIIFILEIKNDCSVFPAKFPNLSLSKAYIEFSSWITSYYTQSQRLKNIKCLRGCKMRFQELKVKNGSKGWTDGLNWQFLAKHNGLLFDAQNSFTLVMLRAPFGFWISSSLFTVSLFRFWEQRESWRVSSYLRGVSGENHVCISWLMIKLVKL